MLKNMVWGFFEKTGDIETFLEYCKLSDIKSGEKNENEGKRADYKRNKIG